MKDVHRRVVGYWEEEIVPVVQSGKRVIVAVRLPQKFPKPASVLHLNFFNATTIVQTLCTRQGTRGLKHSA